MVSIGQMVEQGLQATFNPNGCFMKNMKNQGKLIVKGERNGRMFTLDVNMLEVNSMLFTHCRNPSFGLIIKAKGLQG